MTPELENKLIRRFPSMYRTYAPKTESSMCWGFDHGDGWFDIIWQLSLALEDELNYSAFQKWWFVFYDKFSLRWNRIIYKLSPARRTRVVYKMEGAEKDPVRRVVTDPMPLDEKIAKLIWKKDRFGNDPMLLKHLSMQSSGGFYVTQVKEKFGTLRFYTSGGNNRIYQLILLAGCLSARTCETCGDYGKLREGGWIRTLCDKCADGRKAQESQND